MPTPDGPPDKTETLFLADYSTKLAFNDAVTALYQKGYQFAFLAGSWVVFQGYNKK